MRTKTMATADTYKLHGFYMSPLARSLLTRLATQIGGKLDRGGHGMQGQAASLALMMSIERRRGGHGWSGRHEVLAPFPAPARGQHGEHRKKGVRLAPAAQAALTNLRAMVQREQRLRYFSASQTLELALREAVIALDISDASNEELVT